MNNRWIYGVELLVFGWIALRGGIGAVRSRTVLARVAGALALASAAGTVALLGAFVLNVRIRHLLHFTPLIGVLLVLVHQTIRAARVQRGWAAPFVGLYATLALLLPRPPAAAGGGKRETGGDTGEDEAEDEAWADEPSEDWEERR